MTHRDTERILQLCQLICREKNAGKFQKLVTELNQLLTQEERNLRTDTSPVFPSEGEALDQ